MTNENRFINVKRFPFQVTYYKDRDIYVLQKTYWFNGMKYQKVGFKKEEIPKLAEILFKIKIFRNEFNKIKKSKK